MVVPSSTHETEERKKETNIRALQVLQVHPATQAGRDPWEDGAPPPHSPPLGVRLSLSLVAVSRQLGALGVQSVASHPGPGS